MSFQPFCKLFFDVAKKETRMIIIGEDSNTPLPAGEYSFHEMFCNDYNCDCARVFFSVTSSFSRDIVATITCGWESYDFYAKWLMEENPLMIAKMQIPTLNLTSPQTDLADDILKLFSQALWSDTGYIERVKQHYKMFRNTINKKKCNNPKI